MQSNELQRKALATYQRIDALNIQPYWCINHGGTTSMYYKDPDGNHVELQIDNFATNEEANAFLDGQEFKENPIGEDFDPADLVARFDAGEPQSELIKWRAAGPRDPTSIPAAYLGRVQATLIRIASHLGALP